MLTLTLATALAGPLEDIARTELENARSIHRAVKAADAMDQVKVSDSCKEADGNAAASIDKARASMDGGDHWTAYEGVHGALVGLRPCAEELVVGPKTFTAQIKAAMRSSDAQLASLEAYMKDRSSEEADKQLEAARVAKEDSRSKTLAGELKPAVIAWYTMVDAVYAAVKATR